jgi:hypothetical protein
MIGSALLTALIFSFIVMIVLSSLAYSYRMSLLSINSITGAQVNKEVGESYIRNNLLAKNLSETIDETIEGARFLTTPIDTTDTFKQVGVNAALYEATSFFRSYDLTHQFYFDNVLQSTHEVIANEPLNNNYTQYSENIYPVNVPYVNTKRMFGGVSSYKLNASNGINDTENGYIGYIRGNGTNLEYKIDATIYSFAVPAAISSDYKFSVGWNLQCGSWSIFLVV